MAVFDFNDLLADPEPDIEDGRAGEAWMAARGEGGARRRRRRGPARTHRPFPP